ncbi:hypothetical protein TcasGA2_TC013778 [Tribolium castaneum]|uniref:Uncharacterized protein n=1 Tax=Tribolium castaneum TaxID=7070 RepID=D6WJH1_TRICA|nr:hypothetical protein TcasGA2_TC013778 [Tribolium castaneum]
MAKQQVGVSKQRVQIGHRRDKSDLECAVLNETNECEIDFNQIIGGSLGHLRRSQWAIGAEDLFADIDPGHEHHFRHNTKLNTKSQNTTKTE